MNVLTRGSRKDHERFPGPALRCVEFARGLCLDQSGIVLHNNYIRESPANVDR